MSKGWGTRMASQDKPTQLGLAVGERAPPKSCLVWPGSEQGWKFLAAVPRSRGSTFREAQLEMGLAAFPQADETPHF